MNHPKPRRLLAMSVAAASLMGTSALAQAETATLDLQYTCIFPILEEQPLDVTVSAMIPSEVEIGGMTPPLDIEALATVTDTSWNGLDFVGTRQLAGSVKAEARIHGPGLNVDLSIDMDITPTMLPEERSDFEVEAFGSEPAIGFRERNRGEVLVEVGNIVMELSPTDHLGKLTGLGIFESECTLNPGQSTVLQRITVGGGEEEPEELTTSLAGMIGFNDGKSTAEVAGTLDAVSTEGNLEGQLALSDTAVSVKIISLFNTLSFDADMQFDAQALAGSLGDNTIDFEAPVDISLPQASLKLFGFNLAKAGGPDCRTTEPAILSVSSGGQPFDTEQGGTVSGTLLVPELQNCGSLDNLANRYLGGSTHPVELTLTPRN